jgi:hypothetical protein
MLKDVTADQFRQLADGGYQFSVECPDASVQQVRLYLSGSRRKFRLAQFDFWFSEFNLHNAAGEQFCEEISPAIEAAGRIPPGTIVSFPSGGFTLTFSIPRSQEGLWLTRAAEYLLDTRNFYSTVPEFSKAS